MVKIWIHFGMNRRNNKRKSENFPFSSFSSQIEIAYIQPWWWSPIAILQVLFLNGTSKYSNGIYEFALWYNGTKCILLRLDHHQWLNQKHSGCNWSNINWTSTKTSQRANKILHNYISVRSSPIFSLCATTLVFSLFIVCLFYCVYVCHSMLCWVFFFVAIV